MTTSDTDLAALLAAEEAAEAFYRTHADQQADSPVSGRYRPSESREQARELLATGQGFSVQTAGSARAPSPPCPFCGQPMYSQARWYCELTLFPTTPATDRGCECNWCIMNREALPGPGKPRKHCQRSACRKSYRSEKNREAYRRRKARQAA